MLNRTSVFIIVAFIFSLALATSASAYTFTQDLNDGIYWRSFPINVTVLASNHEEGEELWQAVWEAMDEWEQALGEDIWNLGNGYVIGSSSGGSVIRWSKNFAQETGFDANTTLAVAVRYQEGTYYAKTEIIINENLENITPYGRAALFRVILHELGHTIGLDHTFHEGIMTAYIGGNDLLQADDIDGGLAVMYEHHRRQEIGYISPKATKTIWTNDSSNRFPAPSCGTVDMGDGPGGGNGGMNSFLSLFLGVFSLFAFRRSCRVFVKSY